MIHPPPQLPVRRDPSQLEARRVETPTHLLFRWYGWALCVILGSYLFLDRGIAHLHIPGTFLYIGETTIVIGLAGLVVGTNWLRPAIARDRLVHLLVIWMLWGLVRAIPGFATYGITFAARDSALWYYGLFALLLLVAVTQVPELPARIVRGFSRILPYVLAWQLLAFGFTKKGVKGPAFLTGVPIFSHKGGNIAVVTAMCIAFMWLVPGQSRSSRQRGLLTALGVAILVLDATQSRGGAVAALIGLIVGLIFINARQRARILVPVLAGVVLVVAVAGVTGVSVHTKKRTISLSGLVDEARASLSATSTTTSSGKSGSGAGTAKWRLTLWSNILNNQVENNALFTGLGFGVNLATVGGVKNAKSLQGLSGKSSADELRSAHNSHLDVFARMGILGAALWILIWGGWIFRMLRVRRRYKIAGDDLSRGLAEVGVVVIIAMLINAFFDPTMEGAQVAAVAWTIFGLGILLSRGPIMTSSDLAVPRSRVYHWLSISPASHA